MILTLAMGQCLLIPGKNAVSTLGTINAMMSQRRPLWKDPKWYLSWKDCLSLLKDPVKEAFPCYITAFLDCCSFISINCNFALDSYFKNVYSQPIIVMKYRNVRFGYGSARKMIPTIKNASQSPQAQENQSAKKAGWVGIIVVWQVKTNFYTSVS